MRDYENLPTSELKDHIKNLADHHQGRCLMEYMFRERERIRDAYEHCTVEKLGELQGRSYQLNELYALVSNKPNGFSQTK